LASERSSRSQVDGDDEPNGGASRDAASLVEEMRDQLLERWAHVLGVTPGPERARLGATLDALVDALKAGQKSGSAEATYELSALSELRAQVALLAEERGLPLTGAVSVALHRALDSLMARDASGAPPASVDPPSDATFHDRFLALLGHDLRNPISAVKLATSILSRDTQSPEARRRTLQRVTSNTDRLLRTLEDSLDYSRLYQGKELALESAPLDLDATSRGVLSALEAAYPTRVFVYESPGVVECVLDKERFVRLLSNLLVAAVEHATPDSETRLKLAQEGEIRITVECTGFELTKEELDHLFDSPLSAPRDRTRRSRGFGVGLFVAQRVIAQHGGTLRAEALSPVGTAFVLTLPLAI
jgi:signal transduction histidine kinase